MPENIHLANTDQMKKNNISASWSMKSLAYIIQTSWKQQICKSKEMTKTYEVCKGCGHSYLLQVTDIFHSPYQGQVQEEIHSGHLSAKPKASSK